MKLWGADLTKWPTDELMSLPVSAFWIMSQPEKTAFCEELQRRGIKIVGRDKDGTALYTPRRAKP